MFLIMFLESLLVTMDTKYCSILNVDDDSTAYARLIEANAKLEWLKKQIDEEVEREKNFNKMVREKIERIRGKK